jgi:hypothetical protein
MKEQQQAAYDGIWLPDGVIPTINYLAIGGGGGGGGASDGSTSSRGGGGGAGGLVFGTFGPTYKQPNGFTGYTLTITVGAGGLGGASNPKTGVNGGDSVISGEFFTLGTLYAYGGGGGGAGSQNAAYGNNGGSGGGGGGWASGDGQNSYMSTALQPTSTYGGYGYRGGVGGYGLDGGGGGGAGGQGVDNRTYNSSTGQWGIATNTPVTGGPGRYVNVAASSSYAGTYGIGGSQVGTTVVGYGSGGGAGVGQSVPGGVGNNGVVVFWYNISFTSPSVITGSYTYSVQNGFRIYAFDYPGGTIAF